MFYFDSLSYPVKTSLSKPIQIPNSTKFFSPFCTFQNEPRKYVLMNNGCHSGSIKSIQCWAKGIIFALGK